MRHTLVVLTFLILSVCTAFSQVSNKKIKDLEKKRMQAIREIENTTSLLKESKKSTASLINRINLLSEQITSRQKLISLLNQEVDALTEQQTVIAKEIEQLQKDLKDEQQAYAKAVDGMVLRKQKTSKLVYVLSGKSLGESMRRIKYLKDYSQWRSDQIVTIKNKQKELEEKKRALDKSKTEKLDLLNDRKKERLNLEEEEKQHKEEVTVASKKQVELQSILQKKQKQAENLNVQIERLIAEEVARQEREAKRRAEEQARREREKQEQARREAERKAKENAKTGEPVTKLPPKTTAENISPKETKESAKLSSDFSSNKGRLLMPVTGRYRIVGRFGTHKHNQWNVTTNSSGIDIQAQAGSQARAVFEGEVSRVMAFPGYNNCVIIRHGGYYTFYGNIQNISVRQGQKVETGQSLGTIYTDSDTGGSQLHFQLWRGTNKLNPEPWLQK